MLTYLVIFFGDSFRNAFKLVSVTENQKQKYNIKMVRQHWIFSILCCFIGVFTSSSSGIIDNIVKSKSVWISRTV